MADNTSLAIRCLNIIHPIVLPDSNVVTEQLSAMLKTEEVRRGGSGASSSSTNSISNSSTNTRRSKTTSMVTFSDCDEPIFQLQRDTKGCNCILEQDIHSSSSNLSVPRNGDGGRPFREKFSSLSIHSMKANDNSTNISTASTASTTTANTSSSGSSSFDEVTLGPGMNNPNNNDKKSSYETQERKEQKHYHGRDSTSEEREKNALYRLRMSEWAYRIIDHFGASRENVAISFEYLDRFYASGLNTCNSSLDYKLASITALYIALKVHNRTTIKASTLSSLSRGEITVSDIIDMESLMLDTLSYHLCPPTCYTFISLFYAFVPASVRERVGHPLMQHAIYLTELSVMDISFQSVKASHIALAAMLNVMEVMGEEAVPSWARSRFVRDVEECMLETSLQQEEGNDNEFPTAEGCAANSTEDRNGEGCNEEGTSTLMFNRYDEEKSLFIKILWQSVHSTKEKLWNLLSRNNFLDQENMFFFYARAPFRSIGSNSEESALEGRDDAPTSRT